MSADDDKSYQFQFDFIYATTCCFFLLFWFEGLSVKWKNFLIRWNLKLFAQWVKEQNKLGIDLEGLLNSDVK